MSTNTVKFEDFDINRLEIRCYDPIKQEMTADSKKSKSGKMYFFGIKYKYPSGRIAPLILVSKPVYYQVGRLFDDPDIALINKQKSASNISVHYKGTDETNTTIQTIYNVISQIDKKIGTADELRQITDSCKKYANNPATYYPIFKIKKITNQETQIDEPNPNGEGNIKLKLATIQDPTCSDLKIATMVYDQRPEHQRTKVVDPDQGLVSTSPMTYPEFSNVLSGTQKGNIIVEFKYIWLSKAPLMGGGYGYGITCPVIQLSTIESPNARGSQMDVPINIHKPLFSNNEVDETHNDPTPTKAPEPVQQNTKILGTHITDDESESSEDESDDKSLDKTEHFETLEVQPATKPAPQPVQRRSRVRKSG